MGNKDRKEYWKTYVRSSRKKGAIPKPKKGCISCTKEWRREYYLKNKEKIHKRNHKWVMERMKVDTIFKLKMSIRDVIRKNVKKAGMKTCTILDCSYLDFHKYIESKFESWMNWDNYGKCNNTPNFGWDLDHIIPISSAKTQEELIKLNHYNNFQPLCSYKNRAIKRNNINV